MVNKNKAIVIFVVLVAIGAIQFARISREDPLMDGYITENSIVAYDYEGFQELERLSAKGDKEAVLALIMQGKAYVVESPTRVTYQRMGKSNACVAVVNGGYHDKESWVCFYSDIVNAKGKPAPKKKPADPTHESNSEKPDPWAYTPAEHRTTL